jgi:hypothetical protein
MATLRPAALAGIIGAAALCALSCGGNSLVDQACPSNPQRMAASPAMTASEFCKIFIQSCTGTKSPPGAYITEAECESAYSGLMFDSTRECRSYHICNSASYDTSNALLHCRHAVGLDLCPDTAP